jgi:hypothetical protein
MYLSNQAGFAQLSAISFDEWQQQPTIHEGQYDNQKFDSPRFRVWVTRCSVEDYDGDVAAYEAEKLVIEKLIDGRWTQLDKKGRPVR